MKFVGHTMAAPGMEIPDSIALFHELGLDGIEIAAQEGTPFQIGAPDEQVEQILEAARRYDIEIVTLTPYYWDINSADSDVARRSTQGLCEAVRLAKRMGARYVRAYGGRENAGGTPEENTWRAAVALRQAGLIAEQEGVTLVVENHPGTCTRTGKATRAMVEAVGMESVRALYDPCNVLYDTGEDWLTTLLCQREILAYIHCKDYRMEEGARRACVVGEGIVPWLEIMRRLKGYDGYCCFEYEKRWYPDQLEDARTGLVRCRQYMKEAAEQ